MEWTRRRMRTTSLEMVMVNVLIGVCITQMYAIVKTQ